MVAVAADVVADAVPLATRGAVVAAAEDTAEASVAVAMAPPSVGLSMAVTAAAAVAVAEATATATLEAEAEAGGERRRSDHPPSHMQVCLFPLPHASTLEFFAFCTSPARSLLRLFPRPHASRSRKVLRPMHHCFSPCSRNLGLALLSCG